MTPQEIKLGSPRTV
jgi:hypothetical protein